VTIEIRNPAAEDLRAAMETTHIVFADPLSDEHFERDSKLLPLHRFYAADDDGLPVGTAADYEFRLSVPGGELATAGVTWVGVLPSHRRRGILTQLMQRELDVADLASVYLGGFSFARLAAAERVRELKDGALARADALFRTERTPYCPEDF
jgi:predicted acetyltransferase